MLSKTLRPLLLHAVAWLVFIMYELGMVWIISPPQNLWWEYPGYYLINIALFYFNAFVVLNFVFNRKRSPYLLLPLLALELTLYILLEYGLDYFYNIFRPFPKAISLNLITILGYIWRALYFIAISTAYWLMLSTLAKNKKINRLQVQRLKAEKEKSELEKNLVRSHNAFLQAQINPHLLFNTLNFLYNAVQDIAPKASDGILLLSDIMHYALKKVHEDGKTDLKNEVDHITKYVALNQLRFSYPLHLQVHSHGRFTRHRIPPLVLLTFVENLFKHGDLTDPEHPATICIRSENHRLHFEAANKKRKHYSGRGHGIGIQNATTRLRDFYGKDGFNLQIREDDVIYAINLNINLAI